MWEFFAPLLNGATLAVAPPHSHRDPNELVRTIHQHGVTTLQLVPSLLRMLLDHGGAIQIVTSAIGDTVEVEPGSSRPTV